jgi:excisionase family DNA binding protein
LVRQEAQVPENFTAAQLSEYLQIPEETLRKWRLQGTGPKYVRIGKHVRYRRMQVDRWLEQREREAAGAA